MSAHAYNWWFIRSALIHLTVACDVYDFIELFPYHQKTSEDNFHHVSNCHALWGNRDSFERRLAMQYLWSSQFHLITCQNVAARFINDIFSYFTLNSLVCDLNLSSASENETNALIFFGKCHLTIPDRRLTTSLLGNVTRNVRSICQLITGYRKVWRC